MYIVIEFKPGTNEEAMQSIADQTATLLRDANFDEVVSVEVMSPLDIACYYGDD